MPDAYTWALRRLALDERQIEMTPTDQAQLDSAENDANFAASRVLDLVRKARSTATQQTRNLFDQVDEKLKKMESEKIIKHINQKEKL